MLHSVFMNIRFQIVGVAIQGQLKGALYLDVKEIIKKWFDEEIKKGK